MKLYRAHVDSPNFSFEAYGHNREGARANLSEGLRKHAQQTGAIITWLIDAQNDITVYSIDIDKAYRNGMPL